MKVIHLPTTVGGNPQGISRHLNELGVKSETWTLRQNYFGYPADKVIFLDNNSRLISEFKKFLALRYVFLCDIVFFNFGTSLYQIDFEKDLENLSFFKKTLSKMYSSYVSFMGRLELFLLKKMNVPIFIQYQGDDARQGDFSRLNFDITFANRVEENYYPSFTDDIKRKQIVTFSKSAAKIYALNPDLLHVLPDCAEFLPYSHVNLTDWEPCYTQLEERPLRIGHAPTNRSVKGTDLIINALDQLEKDGYKFEFVLIEGYSNAEAKEIYKGIDVLVDQLFAGWYGGLAVESMALGKPVIAYIREQDLQFIPLEMRDDLPIFRSEPENIYTCLANILNMTRQDLLSTAKKSRTYVEKWHDPIKIAERIKRDMMDQLKNRK